MKSKHRNKINFLPYYLVFISFLIILLVLVGFEYGIFAKKTFYEVTIKDECSLIMGNLIHEIGSESNCKLACETECNFIEKEMYNFSFESKNVSCNSCLCNCRG